jgi:large subunit ribosomal protein L18
MAIASRQDRRKKRHVRVRRKVKGTAGVPRVCVTKSGRHIYVQVIDDVTSSLGSVSLMQVTTNNKGLKDSGRKSFCNIESAKALGKQVGEALKAKGVTKVCFDRGGYEYHGIVQALADSVRECGIEF